MSDLTPITREEKLYSGEDLEPITRKEQYIRHLYDETQIVPEKPITREEEFLLVAAEELHEPTIEQLNVSSNGTYSEQGKAFSPVVVDVPQPTLSKLTVTQNGTQTAPSGTAWNEVETTVPAPSNALFKQTLSNLPSPIATFTGADAPIDSLKASIVGVQSGSGDPSPSNVRPITGWSSCVVNRTGKNLIDDSEVLHGYFNQFGNFVDSAKSLSYEAELKAGTYTFSTDLDNCVITRYFINDEVYEPITETQTLTINLNVNFDFKISIRNVSSTVISVTPQTMIEIGDVATTYEPYNGNTYTIPFKDSSDNPITVYDGVIDVTGGKLTVTHANIASYNGETINEPWISSKDVYTQGATPTTGAQVVYPLTTPIDYDFNPIALRSNGVTNISVNCGEVTELKYYSDTP